MLPGLLLGRAHPDPEAQSKTNKLRRPIALALADDGQLLVANRDSGTISALDTNALMVVGEWPVGRKLSSLSLHPNGTLLATDEDAGEVVWLAYRQGSLRERRRLPAGVSPVSVRITDDGTLASVAGLWPRQLRIFDLKAIARDAGAAEAKVVDLPFAPRGQYLAPKSDKLIVVDAFGGKVAVVDLRLCKLESVRELAAHNIRGLGAAGATGLWLSHQVLHAKGRTTTGEIRTGNLFTNNVRRLPLADLVNPRADVSARERLYFIGDVERGAGDPAAVAEDAKGNVLVALAGVNELAIGRPAQGLWTRLAVGRRPTAVAVDAARERAYVANTFDDSISVVDMRGPKVVATISLGTMPALEPHQRGELLFFDARLSFESWYSCHSCHADGHTNGRLNDNFTDGSFGTPKRVLSLLGVKDTGPWAWNGRMKDLHSQIRTSLTSTMQGPEPQPEQVEDLAAFLRTLGPPPSVARARGTIVADSVKRGQRVFARQKCAACHTPPAYTSPKVYDVGLRDEAGGTSFNPPSLRGVSQAGPYFHDNRAQTLEEVFTRHKHQVADTLAPPELSDLLRFLESL